MSDEKQKCEICNRLITAHTRYSQCLTCERIAIRMYGLSKEFKMSPSLLIKNLEINKGQVTSKVLS